MTTHSHRLRLPEHWMESTRPLDVVFVGVGGTGSMLLDALASLHVALRQLGHPGFAVTAYDADAVSRFNLGRQRFSVRDVGINKAIALVARINHFYGVNWRAQPTMADADECGKCDLLITCVDSAAFRFQVGKQHAGRRMRTLWCDLGSGADNGQVILGHLGDAKDRVPNVYDFYADQLRAPIKDDLPSCSMEEALARQSLPVNRVVADLALNLLYHLIRNGSLDYHGAQFTLQPPSVVPIKADPQVWSFMGYEAPDAAVQPRSNGRRKTRRAT